MNKYERENYMEILNRIKRYKDRFKNALEHDNIDYTDSVIKEIKKNKNLTKAIEIERKFINMVREIQMSKLIVEFFDDQGNLKPNLKNLILYIFLINTKPYLDIKEIERCILEFNLFKDLKLSLFQIFINIIELDSFKIILIDDKDKDFMDQKYKINKSMFQQYFKVHWEKFKDLLLLTFQI